MITGQFQSRAIKQTQKINQSETCRELSPKMLIPSVLTHTEMKFIPVEESLGINQSSIH